MTEPRAVSPLAPAAPGEEEGEEEQIEVDDRQPISEVTPEPGYPEPMSASYGWCCLRFKAELHFLEQPVLCRCWLRMLSAGVLPGAWDFLQAVTAELGL